MKFWRDRIAVLLSNFLEMIIKRIGGYVYKFYGTHHSLIYNSQFLLSEPVWEFLVQITELTALAMEQIYRYMLIN